MVGLRRDGVVLADEVGDGEPTVFGRGAAQGPGTPQHQPTQLGHRVEQQNAGDVEK